MPQFLGPVPPDRMRLPENLKEILRSLNKAKDGGEEEGKSLVGSDLPRPREDDDEDEEEVEEIHSMPAGVWPKQVDERRVSKNNKIDVTVTFL